ncbi:MAG: hypothetical protein MK188_04045 [Gammaproteobacteria bacterium]|nr:hypothetical protein [Gammaproteobacteria bacterium]
MKIVCDTHVHCYQFEQLAALLDAATKNLSRQPDSDAKLLFFTDGAKDPTWEILLPRVKAGGCIVGEWRLNLHIDRSLIKAHKGELTIYLAPAKQINSAQKIEFLLLGCSEKIDEGMVESTILDKFSDRYAVICPWGVGKWLGSRGATMSELINQHASQFLLGDNGGRPKIWSKVRHFEQHPSSLINGSDPLPLSGEIDRVGRFGICFDIEGDQLTLDSVLQAIRASNHHNFGDSMGLFQFFKLQLGLRVSS